MKKIAVIEMCNSCPYFDNIYYDYARTCLKLYTYIENPDTIPPDCPLDDYEEVEDD